MFVVSSDNIHELTDVVCYIKFCKDTIIPTKEVMVHPNNKPLVFSDFKRLIYQRKAASNRGDETKVKELVRAEIKQKSIIKIRLRQSSGQAAG